MPVHVVWIPPVVLHPLPEEPRLANPSNLMPARAGWEPADAWGGFSFPPRAADPAGKDAGATPEARFPSAGAIVPGIPVQDSAVRYRSILVSHIILMRCVRSDKYAKVRPAWARFGECSQWGYWTRPRTVEGCSQP